MGAWIEISNKISMGSKIRVAPYMGAWIEISLGILPLVSFILVAPYMGAWIEI